MKGVQQILYDHCICLTEVLISYGIITFHLENLLLVLLDNEIKLDMGA